MGWKERAWYLGDHGKALFDTNGNAGPTVWADGRVVGGWAQRRDGEIAVRLLEDTGAEVAAAIDAEAARLGAWYGDVRTTPRFRTPLERELTA
jgi:Winged helix DNA-binding domain